LAAWWRERAPLGIAWEFAARKTVPEHRLSWIYLLGGAALFLFAIQVATGCLLMLYYQPTEAAAHASVSRIMNDVPYGWLLRSVHVWGADAFVATVVLHLLTVLLTKAYRRPRELTWITGAVLLVVTLGLGFSGYLLPWNQLSYFATLVGTQIPGCVPLIGETAVHVLRGGDQVTGDTLTRFYAAHVVMLPGILAIVLVPHLGLVQLQGMSLPLGTAKAKVRDHVPFFSEFLLTDACLWLLLLGALLTLAVYAPAEVAPEADRLLPAPEGIKPEWYFLFVFQLLKYVPERVGVFAVSLLGLLLFAVPFLDRRAAQDQRSPWFTALYLGLIAAAVALQIRAIASPSVHVEVEPLVAETYRPVPETFRLIFLWVVIGFVMYYLQQLRRHNRRIRELTVRGESGGPVGIT
jgi:cytochrome b6